MQILNEGLPGKMRVIVVQSDPDIRRSIVQCVERSGSSLQVIAHGDDVALGWQWLDAMEFDLLITEISSSAYDHSAPVAGDGIALACAAHQRYKAAAILVTAEPATSAITADLAEANVAAYIHITSILFDAHSQAQLTLALQFMCSTRSRGRDAISGAPTGAELDTAIALVDRQTDTFAELNNSALALLGVQDDSVDSSPWWQLTGSETRTGNPLTYAVEAGVTLSLPPTLLQRQDGQELIVTGQVAPKYRDGIPYSVLALRALDISYVDELALQLTTHDTVAILGVDRFDYGKAWSSADTTAFMMDIRTSLLEIVRSEDIISLPQNSCITIVFRGIGMEEALDVSNAALSHLHAIPKCYGFEQTSPNMSVGLAGRNDGDSGLAAMVNANTALLLNQYRASNGEATAASIWDNTKLVGAHLSNDGVFSGRNCDARYVSFLSALSAIKFSQSVHCESIIRLLLKQFGVIAAGVFRRTRDGESRYLAGGVKGEDEYSRVTAKVLKQCFTADISNPNIDRSLPGERIWLADSEIIQPLIYRRIIFGYLVLKSEGGKSAGWAPFSLDAGGLHILADRLPGLRESHDAPEPPHEVEGRLPTPLDLAIEGYVVDNMEGAVDQATFLAKVDMPVAIIGPRGTGKLYIAKVIHQESKNSEGKLVQVDCREFRNREKAAEHIATVLKQSEGKTLVFKSPHLLSPDVQAKLARQISTRTLADVKPARYLPSANYVALFPDSLEKLVAHSGLTEKLAGVFAGYPIVVPPVRDRRQAVLRWAHKILGQESAAHDKVIKGFTPGAEQAMLSHDWPGNISEMRQCISAALDKTEKEWITPVDLGIFKGLTGAGKPSATEPEPYLLALEEEESADDGYSPTTLEDLDVALAEAVSSVAKNQSLTPLGVWVEDELVLAITERYRGDTREAAEFLHTRPRNIGRWMPGIVTRLEQRNASLEWKGARRMIGEWVRESAIPAESPLQVLQNMLLFHVANQCADESVAARAKIMAVSIPTYHKRLQLLLESK